MTPREDIDRVIANLETEHGDCIDGCSCFDRLTAALRGEQDPLDRNYKWPILHYGCAEPPVEGPESPIDHATQVIMGRIVRDMWSDASMLEGFR